MQISIRGIINKQSQLNELLNKYHGNHEIHVVILVESWLNSQYKHLLDISNYKYYGKEQMNKR